MKTKKAWCWRNWYQSPGAKVGQWLGGLMIVLFLTQPSVPQLKGVFLTFRTGNGSANGSSVGLFSHLCILVVLVLVLVLVSQFSQIGVILRFS